MLKSLGSVASLSGHAANLTPNDRLFIRRHTHRVAKFLMNRYKQLGEDRVAVAFPIKDDMTLRIDFMRQPADPEEGLISEARLYVDIGLTKPRTQRELEQRGLTIDPEHPFPRRLLFNGDILRPGYTFWNRTEITNLSMSTAPSTGELLFNKLIEGAFIEHPENTDFYVPVGMSAPRPSLLEDESEYGPLLFAHPVGARPMPGQLISMARLATGRLKATFSRAYGHIFEKIDFRAYPETQTFSLALTTVKDFAQGNPFMRIEGDMEHKWAKDPAETTLRFKIRNGLVSKAFNANAHDSAIYGDSSFDILDHARAADMLYALISSPEAGRLNISSRDFHAARDEHRASKPTPDLRTRGHRRDRHEDNRAAKRLTLNNI